MDETSTTLRGVAPPRTRAPTRDRTETSSPAPPAHVAAGLFLGANVFAVGVLVASAWTLGPRQALAAWSLFCLCNAFALALALLRRAPPAGNASSLRRALFVILSLAWAAGILIALPYTSDVALNGALAALCVLSCAALPLAARARAGYAGFVSALTLAALLASALDGANLHLLALLGLGGLTLLLAGTLQARTHAALRLRLHRLVSNPPATPSVPPADDAALLDLADARLASQATEARGAAVPARALAALGEALVATDADGRIVAMNPAAETLSGITLADARGRAVDDALRILHPPRTGNRTRVLFERARDGAAQQHSPDGAQLERSDGSVLGIDYTVTPCPGDDGGWGGSVWLLRDVTERRQRSEITTWQATHDLLTGAINRGEFEARLKKLLRRGQERPAHPHALLCIDVDRFKTINDTYGHAAGDVALKTLGELLRARIRAADTLARIGGDEFAALLYGCGGDRARLIAEGLRSAVDKHHFEWQGVRLPLTVSIGLAELGGPLRGAGEVLRAADAACYQAKALGRNRVRVADGALLPPALAGDPAMERIRALQDALQHGRLELHYAPLAALAASPAPAQCELVVGLAVAGGHRLLGPDLRALAARSQLLGELDRWTVGAALDALRLEHPALAGMSLVLLPLSAASCNDERLLQEILRTLKSHPDLGRRLGFVLEDASVIAGREYARYFLAALTQHGCRLMLADLGFGGAAIALARELDAKFLGLDAALVEAVLGSSADYEAVLGLTRVAHSLGMQTVAARAESVPLRDALARLGVDFVKNGGPSLHRIALYDRAQWV